MEYTWIKAAFVVASVGWSISALAQSNNVDGNEEAPRLADCPIQLGGRGATALVATEPFECYCSVEARGKQGGYAFGSGPYDAISNICMAALHAGATGPDGGAVRVVPGPVVGNYVGTLANGVFSSDWENASRLGSFNVEAIKD